MRRKAGPVNPLSPTALSDSSEGPKSPASTGAMDDLLQKLRAAKPEAKDQRDRRRRARLKDRHQVRVASGQKIPELGVNMDEEEGGPEVGKSMLSPTSEGNESVESAIITSPTDTTSGDVADRAAALLEGLQGGTPSALNKDGSLSVRRRRENADTERERRRRRRQQASTASSARSEDGQLMSPTAIPEEGDAAGVRRGSVVSGDGTDEGPGTPITVVHPPSPEQKREGGKLLTPPPES
jgi:cytokinesis protein